MKKFLLLFFCVLISVRASDAPAPNATVTEDTKLEFVKSKGSIGLKKGSPITVIGKDGDNLEVLYRNIQGRVLATKTNFKGEIAKVAPVSAEPKPAIIVNPAPTPVAKPADPKPVTTTAAAPTPLAREPQSMYGKMVKKAHDNEQKHKDNLVDPANEVMDAKK